ncbi:hypothetical protein Hanom_Chr06g00572391 [Helianthus anomalus]
METYCGSAMNHCKVILHIFLGFGQQNRPLLGFLLFCCYSHWIRPWSRIS